VATRIIQVGLGTWGSDWAKTVVPQIGEVEAVAWVDLDPALLTAFQATHAVPPERCFTSLETGLAAVEAEAVLVTASLPGHVPVARAALEAGKHVLMEKPFAPTLADAEVLVELAAACGRILMISQNYRFYPAMQEAARLVREEALGPVGAVTVDFRRFMPASVGDDDPYLNQEHPLLTDMAIHHFDLMRAVLGQEPVSVSCQAWNPPWRSPRGMMSATATVAFERGAVVTYRGSWASSGPKTAWAGEWHLECARGEIVWTGRGGHGLEAERVAMRPLDEPERELTLPQPDRYGRAGSLAAFAAAVAAGIEPPSSGRDNLGSIALMGAAIASAASGRTEGVPRREA
jgi:predicted dehydrogenase